MGGRINAARQAADHHNAGPRQVERNFVGGDETFLGRRTRADHRDTNVRERPAIAADPETFGRVGDFRQKLRVFENRRDRCNPCRKYRRIAP